jgi:tRNA-modifying protein YgfZ
MSPVVSATAYDAARRRAAVLDRSDRGRIVVSGADRASYLQGLLTNDIAALKAGEGCYAAYLTPQGRMITDLYVYELGDVILLTMDRAVKDTVLARLDQFLFSEDVQLGDVSDAVTQVGVIGPEAAAIVSRILGDVSADRLRGLAEHANVRTAWNGEPAIVTRITDAGVSGYDVFVDRAKGAALLSAVTGAGAVPLDEETAEALRIESGAPRFNRDMDEETIPLEAGIESRAISFSKGCYVGQEVIIRVLHRGHGRVARKLVGLIVSGEQPPVAGATVRSGEREIGHVTSSAWSPALQKPVALAYVHRDFVAPGTAVAVDGAAAEVTSLPIVKAAE